MLQRLWVEVGKSARRWWGDLDDIAQGHGNSPSSGQKQHPLVGEREARVSSSGALLSAFVRIRGTHLGRSLARELAPSVSPDRLARGARAPARDRKSTRLNSSHVASSYAVL